MKKTKPKKIETPKARLKRLGLNPLVVIPPSQLTSKTLKAKLDRLGLNQVTFAALIGVHERTVSRWMHKHYRIPDYVGLALDRIEKERG